MRTFSQFATLNLTALEERCCPTASVFAQNHVLYISTDVWSDTVLIRDNGQGNMTVSVRDHGGIQFLAATGIDQIVMHLNGQADWVDIISSNPLNHPLDVKVDMGNGANDRLFVEMNGGINQGGSLDVELDGKLGHSVVDTVVAAPDKGTLEFADHLSDSDAPSLIHILDLSNHGERIYVG
jgi:hypothetical protein